jgi:hypothetical protein
LDKSRVFWVDAICISQQDIIERGCQVALMGEIYSQAAQTMIWLGLEGPKDEAIFSQIRGMAMITQTASEAATSSYLAIKAQCLSRCARL